MGRGKIIDRKDRKALMAKSDIFVTGYF
jgi:hypothetical protein